MSTESEIVERWNDRTKPISLGALAAQEGVSSTAIRIILDRNGCAIPGRRPGEVGTAPAFKRQVSGRAGAVRKNFRSGLTNREAGGSLRRFAGTHAEPERSIGLSADHPAIRESRTLFPTTVVGSMESPRILVSGENNAKLGGKVMKGALKGMPIFHVTLEERATCPPSCAVWRECYGNAMHMARRHRVDAHFLTLLKAEVALLMRQHPKGILVRLHALGDFPSLDYVMTWLELLAEWPTLHIFGYTARRLDADDAESRKIAAVIAVISRAWFRRFAIRWSRAEPVEQGSVVVDAPAAGVLMCPAQVEKTAACATCAICWSPAAKAKTIGFLRHGMKR